MLLNKDQVQHVNSISHAGKVVIVATCDDGSLHHTVRQDGFEQSCLRRRQGPLLGWEGWKLLPLRMTSPVIPRLQSASARRRRSRGSGAIGYGVPAALALSEPLPGGGGAGAAGLDGGVPSTVFRQSVEHAACRSLCPRWHDQ